MAAIQAYFRQQGNYEFAGSNSHKYGTSPSNQRIEAWWSYYRRGRSSWWIDFLKKWQQLRCLILAVNFTLNVFGFVLSRFYKMT
jgi:Uri superfamily endonuclease